MINIENFKKIFIPAFLFSLIFIGELRAQDSTFYRPLRRQPLITPADSARSIESLVREIKNILNDKAVRKSKYAIGIYSLDTKKMLYEYGLDRLLTPASNTKLFTSFAALTSMGFDYRINTSVYTDGTVLNDTLLKGNIYLVGHGDALLSVPDVDSLAVQIAETGIKAISGGVFADGTFFDNMTDRKVYSGDRDRVQKLPPVTGLSIERNVATIKVTAEGNAGDYVDVEIIPDSESFSKYVTAKVRGYRKSGMIESIPEFEEAGSFELQRMGDALPLPPYRRRSVRVSMKMLKDGRQQFRVSGYLYANRSYSYRYHIEKPELAAAGLLKSLLKDKGIDVRGDIAEKPLTGIDSTVMPVLVAQFNRPQIDIIKILNKDSDNYLAENIYKMIGAYAGNYDDNAEASRKVIMKELTNLGIECEGCKLNDGSGLSRRNLVKGRAVLELLINASKMPFYNLFDSTMSFAGVDGTLEKRMKMTTAQANLHGKTGTLRNVSALSGYVRTLDNERLAFAFIFNGSYVSAYKDTEDKLGILLSQFFYFNEEH